MALIKKIGVLIVVNVAISRLAKKSEKKKMESQRVVIQTMNRRNQNIIILV
jgi:hypothetical protein